MSDRHGTMRDEAIATAENAVSVVSADLTAAGRDGEPG